jgi:hypothetical protein
MHLWPHGIVLLVVVAGLFWVYRSMGGGGPVSAADLTTLLEDVLQSTGATAARLAAAIQDDAGAEPAARARLNDIADACRKEFQTNYYRALRLRPVPGERDTAATSLAARDALVEALEDYEWASRMAGAEAVHHAAIRQAVSALLQAGDAASARARRILKPVS